MFKHLGVSKMSHGELCNITFTFIHILKEFHSNKKDRKHLDLLTNLQTRILGHGDISYYKQ